MRLSQAIGIQGLSQTLAKGDCPVCAFLENFQSALLRSDLAAEQVRGICNFHAWALAAAVNVANATKVFQTLQRPGYDGSGQIASVRLPSAIDEIDRRSPSELNSELDNLITRSAAGEKTGRECLDARTSC